MSKNEGMILAILYAIGFAGAAVGGVAAYLFYVTMVGAVILAPFSDMEDGPRRLARVAAVAVAMGGWIAVGALVHDWTGSDYAVAGVVSVIALVAAARIPERGLAERTTPTEKTDQAAAPKPSEAPGSTTREQTESA